MQREITLKEMNITIDENSDIEEPILVKRKYKSDLVIISIDEYRKTFLLELDKKLQEGEEDIEKGEVYNAREVFKELRQEYGY